MPDPPQFLSSQLKHALIINGVEVDKQATTVYAMKRENIVVQEKRTLLFSYTSPPLSEIIYHTNQKSINLYAEALLNTISFKQQGKGSRNESTEAIINFWKDKQTDLTGFNQDDGSGLSRLNVITPTQMCSMLSWQAKQKNFPIFKTSLPIAGETGTLKTIANNTVAEGKLFAKSGSMSKIRSYSGYVQTESGELLCFSVIINNYTCSSAEIKSKLEKLMIWMVGL
jgi:D-alanyl-D-alanine carboxypeptidase/D-alanyl-D-alanine-endopeptidase (penicillin-binding protein 4)